VVMARDGYEGVGRRRFGHGIMAMQSHGHGGFRA
jgi:hypothetical protein